MLVSYYSGKSVSRLTHQLVPVEHYVLFQSDRSGTSEVDLHQRMIHDLPTFTETNFDRKNLSLLMND